MWAVSTMFLLMFCCLQTLNRPRVSMCAMVLGHWFLPAPFARWRDHLSKYRVDKFNSWQTAPTIPSFTQENIKWVWVADDRLRKARGHDLPMISHRLPHAGPSGNETSISATGVGRLLRSLPHHASTALWGTYLGMRAGKGGSESL